MDFSSNMTLVPKGIKKTLIKRNKHKQIIKNNLQKVKQHVANHLKRHQMEIIRFNRKLNFHLFLMGTVPQKQLNCPAEITELSCRNN